MNDGPYRSPPVAPPRLNRWSARQLAWASVSTWVLVPCLVGVAAAIPHNMFVVALTPLAALVGLVLGCMAMSRGRHGVLGTGSRVLVFLFGILGNVFMALAGWLAATIAGGNFTRGRQIRHAGALVLPRLARGSAWSGGASASLAVEPELRDVLARAWRDNGCTEHASVAAFARLTLDLMALGAPPALVAASQRDALDEVRHATLCFELARRLDGDDEGPAAFPEVAALAPRARNRTAALAALAVDSLIDGALNEGVSARIIARLARRCDASAIRDVLKALAADEGRHAAHGWDVVRYCVTEGGAPVAAALRGALVAIPAGFAMALPAVAEDGGLERYGIPGRRLIADEYDRARDQLARQLRGLLDAAASARAA